MIRILVAKILLFPLFPFPCIARFVFRKFKNGLIFAVESDSGIESSSGFLIEAFYQSGFSFAEKVG